MRLLRHLESPRAWIAVLGIAVVVSLPGLGTGFAHDDYVHRAILEGKLDSMGRDAFTLYDFVAPDNRDAMRALGALPWWTGEHMQVRFFRPLSSLSLAFDAAVFGRAPVPAHLHSLLYFLIAVALVLAILRMLLPARAAGVGALLYALAGCHATGTGWIAARHVLPAAVFGFLALFFHLRAREQSWPPGRLLALVALAAGMLSSESILGAAALIGAYELFGARGPGRERFLAVLPVVLVCLVYVGSYAAAGYGARGTAGYVDPFHAPGAFFRAAVVNIPVLCAEILASIPSILAMLAPVIALVGAVLGVVFVLLLAALARAVRPRFAPGQGRHLVWLLAGAAAGLLPVCGGVLGGRLVTIPMLAGAALLGSVLTLLGPHARARPWPRAAALYAAAALLLLCNVGLAVFVRVAIPMIYRQVGAIQKQIAVDSRPGCGPDSDAVILAAADPSVTVYAPAAMRLYDINRTIRSMSVLSMAPQDHRVTVVGPSDLEIATLGERKPNWWERFFRVEPIRPGERFSVRDMDIEVIEAGERGPTRVRVQFARPLSAPDLCFLTWQDGRLHPAPLPLAGQTLDVPFAPGPMVPGSEPRERAPR